MNGMRTLLNKETQRTPDSREPTSANQMKWVDLAIHHETYTENVQHDRQTCNAAQHDPGLSDEHPSRHMQGTATMREQNLASNLAQI